MTLQFVAREGGPRLVLTGQIAALDGSGMISGGRMGWTASLNNLIRELSLQATLAQTA